MSVLSDSFVLVHPHDDIEDHSVSDWRFRRSMLGKIDRLSENRRRSAMYRRRRTSQSGRRYSHGELLQTKDVGTTRHGSARNLQSRSSRCIRWETSSENVKGPSQWSHSEGRNSPRRRALFCRSEDSFRSLIMIQANTNMSKECSIRLNPSRWSSSREFSSFTFPKFE